MNVVNSQTSSQPELPGPDGDEDRSPAPQGNRPGEVDPGVRIPRKNPWFSLGNCGKIHGFPEKMIEGHLQNGDSNQTMGIKHTIGNEDLYIREQI